VGSGISTIGLHIALKCGVKTFGIELRRDLHEIALRHQELFNAYCNRWMLDPPSCKIMQGDALEDEEFRQMLATAKLIIANNLRFHEKSKQVDIKWRIKAKSH